MSHPHGPAASSRSTPPDEARPTRARSAAAEGQPRLRAGRGIRALAREGDDRCAEHTLAELAEAIDLGFARWDHSHLHLFRLPDGRELMSGEELASPDESDHGTNRSTLGALELTSGQRFEYVFDLGDDWTQVLEVLGVDADPEEEYGIVPEVPVPIEGWGCIPDQYGRGAEIEED